MRFGVTFLGALALMAFGCSATIADDAEDSSRESLRFEVRVDDSTGEVIVVPTTGDWSPDKENSTSLAGGLKAVEAMKSEGFEGFEEVDSYAYFGADGKLLDVFAAPADPIESNLLLERIPEGGTLKPVKFWNAAPSLPSLEQVRAITQTSIQAALDMVCSTDPRPENMEFEVALGVSLGLEGKFLLNLDWKPVRDCN